MEGSAATKEFVRWLSHIYNCHHSCIRVIILPATTFCGFLSNEPSFVLTVSGLEGTVNRHRNESVVTELVKAVQHSFDLPAGEGIVKFQTLDDSHFAYHLTTASQAIASVERSSSRQETRVKLRNVLRLKYNAIREKVIEAAMFRFGQNRMTTLTEALEMTPPQSAR